MTRARPLSHSLKLVLIPSALMLLAACGGGEETVQLTVEERLAAAPNLKTGERQFLQCAQCHDRIEGVGHRVGPNLWSIYGETAAHHDDFNYSRAMENSGIVWTEETLNAYIENPQAVVPGTRMAFAGLANDADRRDLVAYLKTLE